MTGMNAIATVRNSPGNHAIIKQALGEAAVRASSRQLNELDWLWDHLSPEGRVRLLAGKPQIEMELADG